MTKGFESPNAHYKFHIIIIININIDSVQLMFSLRLSPLFTERNRHILISKALLDRIILATEMCCKINRQTFRGILGF